MAEEKKGGALISVIVPIYNLEQYVEKCIQSIVTQSYAQLEIMLIDDGSTDHSGEICDGYARTDPRITVYHKENGGLSSARNYGIDRCHGEYLCFIDGDDDIQPGYVETLYRICIERQCEIAICDSWMEDISAAYGDDGTLCLKEREQQERTVSVFPARDLLERFHTSAHRIAAPAWNKLYHRSAIGEVRYPEGLIYEDECTTPLYIYQAEKVGYTTEQLYCYRTRPGSIIQQPFSLKTLQRLEGYGIRKRFFLAHNEARLAATEDMCYLSALLGFYYKLRKYLPDEREERKRLLREYRREYWRYDKKPWGWKRRMFYAVSFCFPMLYGRIKRL